MIALSLPFIVADGYSVDHDVARISKAAIKFHKESHKLISQQAILIDIQLVPHHFRGT